MLTQAQLAQVTEKNLENLVRKSAEGKPLTEKELATLEAHAHNQAVVEEAKDGERLTAEKFCEITSLTDRRHRQLAAEGYFPPPINGVYQFTPCLGGMVRYLREMADRNSDSMAEEKLLKTRAERQLAELKLARQRKESLDAQTVFKAWENILLTIRQKMLALPSKLSQRLVYFDEMPKIEAELEREINEALVDLSKPITYDHDDETDNDGPEEVSDGDRPSAETPKTTAKTHPS